MSSDVSKLRLERDRFVGFAFSAAELLLELNEKLVVRYAAGALRNMTGLESGNLIGKSFLDLIAEDDRAVVTFALKQIEEGGRLDPLKIRLAAADRTAVLGACRLPEQHKGYHVTLGTTRVLTPKRSKGGKRDLDSGAWDREGLTGMALSIAAESKEAGVDDKLTLLHLQEMELLKSRTKKDDVDDFVANTGGYLRANSVGGDAVGRLDDDKFGVVHQQNVKADELAKKVYELSRVADPAKQGVNVKKQSIDLNSGDLTEEDIAKVLTYTIKTFAESPDDTAGISSLSDGFDQLMADTLSRLSDLKKTVAGKEFSLVFQPIVDLKTRKVHHYEVLSRFGDGKNPYQVFSFAENIGLIEELDLAVTQNAIDVLRKRCESGEALQLAVNISGRSMGSAIFVKALDKLIESLGPYRRNFLLEVTESAEISDLDKTNEILETFRGKGNRICLDDFGAGASSFEYLQSLKVDFVKIDGAYVKKVTESPKDSAIIKAMVSLCKDLGVHTVGEMVETAEQAEKLKAMGVDFAQGWHFGKPQAQIPTTAAIGKKAKAAAG